MAEIREMMNRKRLDRGRKSDGEKGLNKMDVITGRRINMRGS